ncbi:MAG: hypothetical protein ACXWT1_03905 [Methylobacter sp.]
MNDNIDNRNPYEIKGETKARSSEAEMSHVKAKQDVDTLNVQKSIETDPEKIKQLQLRLDVAAKVLADKEKKAFEAGDEKKSVDYKLDEAKRGDAAVDQTHTGTEINPIDQTGGKSLTNAEPSPVAIRAGGGYQAFPDLARLNKNRTTGNEAPRDEKSAPYFPNKPDEASQDTQNALKILGEIINANAPEDKKKETLQNLIDSSSQPNDQNLYVGEIMPGEKLYAFASAAEGLDRGYKGTTSYYYLTETKLQTMIDHGLIDFKNRMYNPCAISDILALPPGNKINCVVEATATDRVACVELPIGAANWPIIPKEKGWEEVNHEITGKKETPIQIALIDGNKCDFRGNDWMESAREFTQEQKEAFKADYEYRRVSGQRRADLLMNYVDARRELTQDKKNESQSEPTK